MFPLNCLSEPELFLLAFGPENSGCILNSSLKEDMTAQNFSFLLSFFSNLHLYRVWKRLTNRDREELEENKEYDAAYESVLLLCPRVSVRIFFSSEKKGISVFSE